MNVRFLNLAVKQTAARRQLLKAVDRVLKHGRIVLGPEVKAIEKRVADFCGVKYAIGVNSGSDALYFALRALGIGPGDEVITSCLSFVATANAIAMTGAKPVFADIREDFNLDPAKLECLINQRTRAIVPVHFTGHMCGMPAIMRIARKHKITVVEDAAQAYGASLAGKKAGAWGRVSALSMNPMKVLAACGEAGMVLTNCSRIKKTVEALRYNGAPCVTDAHYVSLNGRLDTLQAAILLTRHKSFKGFLRHRRSAADYYNQSLHDIVAIPRIAEDEQPAFYTYNILCRRRNALMQYLANHGIETKIHHPLLIPQQKAYRQSVRGHWPVGRDVIARSLCLPIHEKITRRELDYVIKHVRLFYRAGKGKRS